MPPSITANKIFEKVEEGSLGKNIDLMKVVYSVLNNIEQLLMYYLFMSFTHICLLFSIHKTLKMNLCSDIVEFKRIEIRHTLPVK